MTKPLKTITDKNFQLISPDKLKPYDKNARRHSDDQIVRIVESMREFGQVTPILVTNDMQVIAGHARLEAAKRLGLKTIAIIRIDHLTHAQVRAYTIADNRLAELATWDEAILAGEFEFLMEAEINGVLESCVTITGYDIGQIDSLVGLLLGSEDSDEDINTGPLPNVPIVTRKNDLWLMDKHKSLCGDSTDLDNYKRLIGNDKIAVLATDSPYNIPIDNFVGGKGKIKHHEFANASGEMTSAEFTNFLHTILLHSTAFIKPGGLVYLFMDWRHSLELLTAAQRLHLFHLNTAAWVKNAAGMGSFLRSQHEFCHIFRHGDVPHRNNVMLGKNGRNRSNVWEYPSANASKEGREQLKNHPTPKPVAMIMDIILDCTKHDEIVLDPFLGGGTTIIAAEKTKRVCYGLEIDPAYMDHIVRRWQRLTGKDAVHAVTGLTFAQHEQGAHLTKKSGGRNVRIRER